MKTATLAQKTLQLDELHRRLRRDLPGEALTDDVSRALYANDASLYEFMPLAVVTPRTEEDVEAAVAVAREMGAPVLPRGGGTSLAGQATNVAVVLDFSKHLRRVRAIDADARRATVETGIVRDELNAIVKSHGLEFAPETSTSNRATIAGMIGNNSSGMRSIQYGRTMEHVLGGRLLLPTGDWIECVDRSPQEVAQLAAGSSAEGRVWKGLLDIMARHRPLVEARFPKVMRRVGGYSLDEFPEGKPWNLAKLVCGSEGTLGLLTRATLNLQAPPRHVAIVAVHYADALESLRHTPELLAHDPLSIELMDGELVRMSRANPSTRAYCGFVEGTPGAILAVELSAPTPAELDERVARFHAAMKASPAVYACPVLRDKAAMAQVVELRKKGLGVMLSMTGDEKPVAFVEDAAIPPARLADYVERVVAACNHRGIRVILYGHASVGVIHIRPVMNMKTAAHVRALAEIAEEAVDLVREYGGSWAGEHGDGIARGALNERFWGPEMIGVFREVKRLLDPQGIMNPGRVFATPPINENLRFGAAYSAPSPRTHFRFEDLGGYGGAVELCNGVGECRKTSGGTMCPSYMATRDEEDSTRGRANVLRLALSGKLGDHPIASPEVHRALDLCLECKACKTECPSNVDMARLKSEHLAALRQREGTKARDWLFAETSRLARLAVGPLAPLINAVSATSLSRRLAGRHLGIAPERPLPSFARHRFSQWARGRGRRPGTEAGRRVVLFADCWAETMEHAPARWALDVLERAGYRVKVVADVCCQRTRISKGFLPEAQRDGAKAVARLHQFARRGIPVIALEPSCASSLRDDLPDLVADRRAARQVARATTSLQEFLQRELEAGRLAPPEPPGPGVPPILLHGHCHQKALWGTGPTKAMLAALGADVREVDSGCCGMAGSFGHEAEHYEISQTIGARRLFPAVQDCSDDTIIVADGFSCRHQVADATGRKPLHFAEAYGRIARGKWHR